MIWLSNELLPKIWDFFNEIYIKSVTLKVAGPNHDVFNDYHLIEVFDMYTRSLPNLSSGVMHSHDIVQWCHALP